MREKENGVRVAEVLVQSTVWRREDKLLHNQQNE